MRTHLERLIDNLDALRLEATRMSGRDHEPSDCAALLKDAGGTVETFLKAVIHCTHTRRTFEQLIDDLQALGVAQTDVDNLHALRKLYNRAKHDPHFTPDVDELAMHLRGVTDSLLGWRGCHYGDADTSFQPTYRRRLWIACWDHYIGGDSEILIMTPVEEDWDGFVPVVDTIYLAMEAWPSVMDSMGTSVRPAEGLIPRKFIKEWAAEGDYSGARVYEGEYRELLRAFARAERRLELLPDLKREADEWAMRSALAFSAVDAARSSAPSATKGDLEQAILHVATADYAAPRSAPVVKRLAAHYAELIASLSPTARAVLSGPRFMIEDKYRRLESTALAKSRDGMVSAQGELIIVV